MIQVEHLTKRYGSTTAVDDVSFTVRPGQVTGFLGPNGAGKSTTMRMIVGLDRPSAGRVSVNGMPYADHPAPLHEVGALLEARSVHPGRTAYNHLLALAATHGIGAPRVREVISLAGLESVARKRVGGFSLGMGQRLGIATALLGDPHTVMLDEPELIDRASRGAVSVRSPEAGTLALLLQGPDATVRCTQPGVLEVVGRTSEEIGEVAAGAGIVLHQLTSLQSSLEDAYLQLTAGEVQYRAGGPGAADPVRDDIGPLDVDCATPTPTPHHLGATAPTFEGALR
jgi:ABC-2 type transport system ATP-binding protein